VRQATTEFHESARALPESVGHLRRAIGEFARSHGAGDDVVMALQLATSEALSNAVVHAFADRPEPGTLTASAGREGDQIWVVIRDDGSGMKPRPDSPGLGVGLPLMTRSALSLKFSESPDGGTEVAMRFALGATAA
jgi:serine/threonine-protein kinase RsbW